MYFSAPARASHATCATTPRGKWSRNRWRTCARAACCCCFPKAPAPRANPINPLVGSVGLIAKHAQVPVQTLVIETDSPFLSKGWPLFKRPTLPIIYRVRLGRRFEPPADVAAFTAELDRYYRQELEDALQSRWLQARLSVRRTCPMNRARPNGRVRTWCSIPSYNPGRRCSRPCAPRSTSGRRSGWWSTAAPMSPQQAPRRPWPQSEPGLRVFVLPAERRQGRGGAVWTAAGASRAASRTR